MFGSISRALRGWSDLTGSFQLAVAVSRWRQPREAGLALAGPASSRWYDMYLLYVLVKQ